MKPSGRSASPKRAIGDGAALPANQKHLAASTPVVGAKIGVLDNMSKSDRSLACGLRNTRSHSAKHHAQIVCRHFGDDRSRESNGLRYRMLGCSERLRTLRRR